MSLKEKRLAAGLSLTELSQLTGIHIVTLSRLEHGKISPKKMTLENAVKLADALHCEPRELL